MQLWTITNYSFLQLVWITQMWCWEKESHCMIPFMTSGTGGLQSSCPWGACGRGSAASAPVSWRVGGSGSLTRPALFFWCKLYFNMFWNSNTLATWCEELTHLKRLWCWERLKTGGEGDDRGWDGWMASLIQWTWVWVNSGSWWWTGRPGVLQSMGLQRVGRNWVTELNWTEYFNIHTYL